METITSIDDGSGNNGQLTAEQYMSDAFYPSNTASSNVQLIN